METLSRRQFIKLSTATAAATGFGCTSLVSPPQQAPPQTVPSVIVQVGDSQAQIPFLSWDTEGGTRSSTNLLRSPAYLRVYLNGQVSQTTEASLATVKSSPFQGATQFSISITPTTTLVWLIQMSAASLRWVVSAQGSGAAGIQQVEFVLPLDPGVTPTTVLPATWSIPAGFKLPAILTAPDFGQMLLAESSDQHVTGYLDGNRDNRTVDCILRLGDIGGGGEYTLDFTPIILAPPVGFADEQTWKHVRRAWFNPFQPSAPWGDQTAIINAPGAVLANNVISDVVSFSLPFQADHAFLQPILVPGISAMTLIRVSLDWWLDERTDSTGVVAGYWNVHTFLDSNPGILISAWDYVEATNDLQWLNSRIEQLQMLGDYLASRDIDADGLVEAVQSGNPGTLLQPGRSSNWYDAVNFGWKDAYANALIYRGWRCLADLGLKLGRGDIVHKFTDLATQLKAVYVNKLFNPQTGWLACWVSEDGSVHDYASPIVNGIAIEYGLVNSPQARSILDALWLKIQQVGFTRFDLGLPSVLVPIRADDYLYLQPATLGAPSMPDGSDTFQQYENGGITGGQTIHFLMAHYMIGAPARADMVLQAMIRRQSTQGFQNGVRNTFPDGIDWTTWEGAPCGYEGYLADVYAFLKAILLRYDSFRSRLYRPML